MKVQTNRRQDGSNIRQFSMDNLLPSLPVALVTDKIVKHTASARQLAELAPDSDYPPNCSATPVLSGRSTVGNGTPAHQRLLPQLVGANS